MVRHEPWMSTMPDTPLLLGSLLDRGVWLQPENLLVERVANGYNTLTYREHLDRVKRLADALTKLGVVRGDRVATFCWNTNRHYQMFHAIPCMGAVLHPLNIRLGPTELEFIIGDANDRLCIVDQHLLPQLAAISAAGLSPLDLGVVVCGSLAGDDMPPWQGLPITKQLTQQLGPSQKLLDWDELLTTSEPSFEWPRDIDEHAACALFHTSGTTGNPKGVAYSHRSQYLHTLAMPAKDSHNVGGADVFLPVVPYFHANGWGLPYLTLTMGARVLHNGRYTDPAAILDIAVDHGATYSAAVPAIWQTIRTALEEDPAKYKGKFRVTNLCCGGSAPPLDLMKWYSEEYGVDFAQGWGMTETSPMGSFGRPAATFAHSQLDKVAQFANVDCAGIPVAGVELKIVDIDDFSKDLPNDGIAQGELLARGPWVTARYYRRDDAEATSKFTADGWLATGDVASIRDGALIIRDRSKDVVKSGGEWISSKDLENHIVALPWISECAVVAMAHPKWDERPVVVVVMKPSAAPSDSSPKALLAQIRALLLEHKFAKYEAPDDVILWEALPMTGTGKISKKDIRARLTKEGYLLPELRPQSKL